MPGIHDRAMLRLRQTRRLLMLHAALLLAACATPDSPPQEGTKAPPEPARPAIFSKPAVNPAEQQALQAMVDMQDRLYRVAAPLLVANAELCKGNARNLLGFTAKNRYSYAKELAGVSQKSLGLDERLQIMGVLAGGGAARAGVRRGDIVLAVDGKRLPEGENAEQEAAGILAPMMSDRTSIGLTLLRDGASVAVNVPLTYACAFGVELGNTDNVVAYSDGHRVLVSRGMMGAVRSDDELAYVLAKEMAHNALAHANRLRVSATVGGIIDKLTRLRPDMSSMPGMAGLRPVPQDLDAMADKLSLYMLARAGYGIDQVVPFWQRMASQYPASALNNYTALHPSINYRVAAMEKTIKDIRAKQARKRPLLP
ncbi:MAG TPA: M48 family metallopeptidase [Noviherbaspirillum sp.]|uniref:M48 family metallopeptidase n=1 Tax=Noviherbaspirillum sp. TaxID=1926288 RepID=UPI002D54A19E|nr:M48 family metallopeptidase [Noviherbaspirillum sp.]HYD97717.1 M48 family metallopeptidase [Noviherbaspirillum sp.]